jgi:hypothetical protein
MQIENLTFDMKTGAWSTPFPALDSKRTLVLAFGDSGLMEKPGAFEQLRRAYPSSLVAGCSGSGEIVGTTVRDQVLSVSVVRFEDTSVAAASAPCPESSRSFSVGEALARELNKPSLRAVFVLSDGLNVNGSELVRGINSVLDPSVVVTGGLAGDGTRFKRTWVALGEQVASARVVAVGFYGDRLLVSHGSKGGWDKFGPERVVTRAEGNVLYELDGRPALALYKEYLGEKASGLPATGLLFPLSLRSSGTDDKALVRTLLAVDEDRQTMTFAGDVPQGYLAQLMKADFDRLIGGAATAASSARKLVALEDPNTLAIAVSCVGRRLVLGERTEEEVEAVLEVLPRGARVTGFYSYGELSPYATGRCDLHNQTMTLTTFSESPTPIARTPVRPSTRTPAVQAPAAPAPTRPTTGQRAALSASAAPAPRRATGTLPAAQPRPSAPPPPAATSPGGKGVFEVAEAGDDSRPHQGRARPGTPTSAPERRLTRPAGPPQGESSSAALEFERVGEVTVARIRGRLSEGFTGRGIASAAGPVVLFDLADVERITSFGVREWLQMLADLEPLGSKLYFARCSEAVVNQMGMIRRFSGGGKVLSFFAPYLCAKCGATFSALLDCNTDAEALARYALPDTECPTCAGVGHFDDDARSYLAFGPARVGDLPADVRRALEGLPAVGQVDPIEKRVEGRVTRMRVNCRLDEAVRWNKLFDGLEGEVVLDLASSPSSSAEGVTLLLTALRRLPSEVNAIRIEGCPAPLFEGLAAAPAQERIFLETARVEGFCAGCNARRPAQIRVLDAVEALKLGKEPYVVCRRCNAPLSFEAVRPLLQRLGEGGTNPGTGPRRVAASTPAAQPPPAAATPARRRPTALFFALGGVGAVLVGLLAGLALRSPPPPPVPVVAAPSATAPAVPTLPAGASSAQGELPPAWTEQRFVLEGESAYVVGQVRGAPSQDEALAQARADAELALVQHLERQLAGTRMAEYLAAREPLDVAGNAEPILARFRAQLGSIAALQRSDAALVQREGRVQGAIRYQLSKKALGEAVAFYRAEHEALGMTVAPFFPTLEAGMRTGGGLLVVHVEPGAGARAGVRPGDVLLTLNGRSLPDLGTLSRLSSRVPARKPLDLTVETAGVKRQVRLNGR